MAKISRRRPVKQRFTAIAALILVAAVLAFGPSPAGAATLTGASGLIYIPSADTLGTGDAEIGVRFTDGKLTTSLTYGVFERIEVGINNVKKGAEPAGLGLVLKGAVFEETAERPAVAVGFETGQSYVVVSKRLAPRVRAHAGFGSGELEGLFAGVSLVVSTTSSGSISPATTLLAEVTPEGLNAGVRMVFSPVVSVDLSLIDLEKLSAGVALRTRF